MSKSRGFTIVELVVVIVVVGILAATAIPRFFNRGDYDLRGFHDKALTTLQFARKTAIAARHQVCVTVNSAATPPNLALTISTTDPESNPAGCNIDLTLPSQDGNCGSGVSNRACAPDNITLVAALTNGSPIIFRPSGQPSSSGTLTITSTSGAGSSTVTVEAETGYVH